MYPTGYMLYRFRAELHTRLGNPEQAIADDEMALLIKAKRSKGQDDLMAMIRLERNYILLGDQYSEDNDSDTIPQEQYEAAISIIKEVRPSMLESGDTQQLIKLGRDYIFLGNKYEDDSDPNTDPHELYQEAIDTFQKTTEINPNEATAFYYLGITYEKAGDMEKARENYAITIDMLEEYISVNPDSVDGHFMLGFSYEGAGDLQKAKEEYQTVLDLNPDHQEAQEGMSRLGGGES